MQKFFYLALTTLLTALPASIAAQEKLDYGVASFTLPASWAITEENFDENADLLSVKAEAGECSFTLFGYTGAAADPEDVFYYYFDKIIEMEDVYFNFKGIEKKTIGRYEYYLTEFEYQIEGASPKQHYKGFAYVYYPAPDKCFLIIELENWRFKRKCEADYVSIKESLVIK